MKRSIMLLELKSLIHSSFLASNGKINNIPQTLTMGALKKKEI